MSGNNKIEIRCNGFDAKRNKRCRRFLTEVEVEFEGKVIINTKCPICGYMNAKVITSKGGTKQDGRNTEYLKRKNRKWIRKQ